MSHSNLPSIPDPLEARITITTTRQTHLLETLETLTPKSLLLSHFLSLSLFKLELIRYKIKFKKI